MLAIAYCSQNVPQALMNLMLNNGIAGQVNEWLTPASRFDPDQDTNSQAL